jgi:hypothetical protein
VSTQGLPKVKSKGTNSSSNPTKDAQTPEGPQSIAYVKKWEWLLRGSATAFPEPPPVIQAIARAKDRRAALERVYSGDFSVLPYDRDALIERGEFVPVSMLYGVELGEWCDEDLSEP